MPRSPVGTTPKPRPRYLTDALGAVLGPLLGTALLDHAGRTALWAACSATGLALFAAQQAVAPALRRRTSARRTTSVPPMRSAARSPGKSRPDAAGCQP